MTREVAWGAPVRAALVPVLLVLLMTAIDVYGDYYANRGQPSAPSTAGGQDDVPTLDEPSLDSTHSDDAGENRDQK